MTARPEARAVTPARSDFKHFSRVQIRYNDQDTLGHINNAAYAFYLEHARCEMIYAMLDPAADKHIETVIVRLVIDFLREMTYPGHADVGTTVTRIGTKSFHMRHGIFKAGSDVCSATGETIMVWFDLTRRETIPHPRDTASRLRAFMAE